jgi:hypothetical protein
MINKHLQRDLLTSGIDVDGSTVRRRLLEVGRKARKSIKKAIVDTCNEAETVGMGK